MIYASGLNPDIVVSGNSTSFKLTQTKNTEYVILSTPSSEIIDYRKLTHHQLNHSVGRVSDGDINWGFFNNSTPGSSNNNNYQDYIATPYFNFESGFYDGGVDLTINCDSPNVDVFYTLDGSTPDVNSIYFG